MAVVVYDVTNRQSFLNTPKWIEEACRRHTSPALSTVRVWLTRRVRAAGAD